MPDYLRQLDILDPRLIVFPVTIIGAGGIGSLIAPDLAQMGFKEMTIYDPDIVEEHNRPHSFYRKEDDGKLKVGALKQNILFFVDDVEITIFPEAFSGQRPVSGIVVSGVDSMESRKKIWESIRYNLNVPLYLDGRIGGETIEVFTVRPCQLEDIENYESHLFSDEEAENLPCTAQGIIYSGRILAGLMTSQIKKWLKKERYSLRLYFDLNNQNVRGGLTLLLG